MASAVAAAWRLEVAAAEQTSATAPVWTSSLRALEERLFERDRNQSQTHIHMLHLNLRRSTMDGSALSPSGCEPQHVWHRSLVVLVSEQSCVAEALLSKAGLAPAPALVYCSSALQCCYPRVVESRTLKSLPPLSAGLALHSLRFVLRAHGVSSRTLFCYSKQARGSWSHSVAKQATHGAEPA